MHGYFHGLLLLQLSSVGTHDYVVQGMIRLIDILVISERNGIRGFERRYSLFRRVTSLLLSRGTYACVISALGVVAPVLGVAGGDLVVSQTIEG